MCSLSLDRTKQEHTILSIASGRFCAAFERRLAWTDGVNDSGSRDPAGEAMSWDVFVLNLPPGIRSLDDIPKDFEPPLLGTRADLIAKVVYPQTDFTDPSWGTLKLP